MSTSCGVVVIGRNEGERLKTCLDSVLRAAAPLVYVDSGSSDGSVAAARRRGVAVIELDPGRPFTAARARNEGLRFLRETFADLACVQFVDGDCELAEGWLETAAAFLMAHADVAAVCGRLREKHARHSVYNMLCDIEWDTPLGMVKACGGVAMMRVAAFTAARGYRPELVAGEEPELCLRLRAAGWHIWRLDQGMAVHDAAISRFDQWWKRTQRNGYAFALGAHLHGAGPERHWVRESRSAWLWGFGLPLAAAAGSALVGPWGLAVLALYPLQVVRVALRGGRSRRENWWYALFVVLGKLPEAVGQLAFQLRRFQ